MAKLNCWEFYNCGREPEGGKVNELGVCPAATESRVDGINGGINGGRACWAIAGTFCQGEVQGTFAVKLHNCKMCEFYKLVQDEEGVHWQNAKVIFEQIRNNYQIKSHA